MTTWTLVLFLGAAEPIVVPGFASKGSCDGAADALRKAQARSGPHACVEVKPAPCGYGYTLTPSLQVGP